MPTKKQKNQNIVVECPLRDGSDSMFVGRLVRRDDKAIVLVDASWVAHTGRRSDFFAGRLEGACEVEPYPDGVEVELPAEGARVTTWTHPLPRVVR